MSVLTQGPATRFRRDDTVIAVTGADRLTYLNNVTSQQFTEQKAGVRTGAVVLDGNGVVQAAFGVAILPDQILLLSPHHDVTAYIMNVLAQRTFLLDVTFTETSLNVTELRGDDLDDIAATTNLSVRTGTVRPSGTELFVCGVPDGIEIIGEAEALTVIDRVLDESHVPVGTDVERDNRRVLRGEPAFGHEICPPHLPEEAGILPTHVHLAKGCYPGQEAVARMWMLGRPRRRLALLGFSQPTVAGVFCGTGRDAVDLTTVTSDGLYALAYVPEATQDGEVFKNADATTATVLRLIGNDPNPPGHDPAMTRRRDRRA